MKKPRELPTIVHYFIGYDFFGEEVHGLTVKWVNGDGVPEERLLRGCRSAAEASFVVELCKGWIRGMHENGSLTDFWIERSFNNAHKARLRWRFAYAA